MIGDIKVLIVDDSSIVRRVLSTELDKQKGIRVVATAPDPYIARDKICTLRPDVITLDIEMPRMDGLTFLKKVMKYNPVPTIIVSSLTAKGCDMAIACLEAGAIDVVCKPNESYSVGDLSDKLAQLIRAAANARVTKRSAADMPTKGTPTSPGKALLATTHKVVALGSSTGGTEALRTVLTGLPKTCPGIVMVQHMPPGFTASFAERLNDLCEIEVREARDGDSVLPGLALLAQGDKQMTLARDGDRYIVRVNEGPRVCRHRPSVEVLFESTATYAGSNSLGVIMTGMGSDGAGGMLTMRKAGAMTIAQDEDSCVVFGMPKEAINLGGVHLVSPLDQISSRICEYAQGKLSPKKAA